MMVGLGFRFALIEVRLDTLVCGIMAGTLLLGVFGILLVYNLLNFWVLEEMKRYKCTI
jgi:hypothetical protein